MRRPLSFSRAESESGLADRGYRSVFAGGATTSQEWVSGTILDSQREECTAGYYERIESRAPIRMTDQG